MVKAPSFKMQLYLFEGLRITVEMKSYTSCIVTVSFIRLVLLVDETGVP
jgi:hypothetical protein